MNPCELPDWLSRRLWKRAHSIRRLTNATGPTPPGPGPATWGRGRPNRPGRRSPPPTRASG
eukprot:15435427-Alexandrium_andersonii.AAC.1